LDSLEKREFAGKKAKLAAAELAKLSRRVGGELFNLQFQVCFGSYGYKTAFNVFFCT